jgi:Queuosine biosynthesis protein
MMRLEEFAYDLPEELIAQEPAAVRDRSRMMVVHRKTGEIEIRTFRDLPGYFGEEDVFVVNDSRVCPARLIGRKETGGLIEILLLTRQPGDPPGETWEVLLRPAKRVEAGTTVTFAAGCRARIVRRLSEKSGSWNSGRRSRSMISSPGSGGRRCRPTSSGRRTGRGHSRILSGTRPSMRGLRAPWRHRPRDFTLPMRCSIF